MKYPRRLPVGAEVVSGEGVQFRVWAPTRKRVDVVLEGATSEGWPLTAEADGYFSGLVPQVQAGQRYRYRLDGGSDHFPDPASRFQPEGPHGPSEVVDPRAYSWNDSTWPGVTATGQVIYELHIGTFTPEGTWAAAAEKLAHLAETGITLLEIMPVADFPGRFGWGYDGVNLFAPTRLYGTPDEFRRFVDRAHALKLGVILDVVYNHIGPDGNYLLQYSKDYFTDRYKNEWGEALNFDGPHSGPVREFFIANAGYWIEEYHLDGLRLDATQQIFDRSADNVMAALTRRVREAAGSRGTYIVAENEPQETRLVRPPAQGGYGMDSLWNDDFHHSALVALTGHNDAYYTDYHGAPQEFISAIKYGYLYQGQHYSWQQQRRGTTALDLPPNHFVTFIENHDQVANSGRGLRAHQLTSPGRYKALTALLLLAPPTPMLFQGQEFAASSPFLYFADHNPELAKLVSVGRNKFLAQFRDLALPEMQACLTDPAAPETFERCKLNWDERKRHATWHALHCDLLRLRREEPLLRQQKRRGVDGAVLGPQAFCLRFFADEGADGDDRLLLINLGCDLRLVQAPEPLLAPPADKAWTVRWSSADVRYDGCGTPEVECADCWRIPGEAAIFLVPAKRPDQRETKDKC